MRHLSCGPYHFRIGTDWRTSFANFTEHRITKKLNMIDEGIWFLVSGFHDLRVFMTYVGFLNLEPMFELKMVFFEHFSSFKNTRIYLRNRNIRYSIFRL